jgi:hypothetical protein
MVMDRKNYQKDNKENYKRNKNGNKLSYKKENNNDKNKN